MKKRFGLMLMSMFLFFGSGMTQVTSNIFKLAEGHGAMSELSSIGGPFYSEDNSYYTGTKTEVSNDITYTLVYRSVMTFNCNNIPANSYITSAALKFQPQRQNTSVSSKTKITLLSKNSDYDPAAWFSGIGGGTEVKKDANNSVSSSIDITEIVKSAYSNNNDKKLYFGFVNTNEATVGSLTWISSTYIEVKYQPAVTVIVENSFKSGTVIVDGSSFPSGKSFKWVYNSNHIIENYDQTIGNIFYDFKYWTFGSSTTSTTNSWTVATTVDRIYTAIYDTYNNVKFANRVASTDVPDTKLTILNNNDEIDSGDRRTIKVLESRDVKTNHETLPAAPNKKHNRWNSNKSDFKLKHNLIVSPETFDENAQFEPLQPVTVTPSLDGVPVTGSVEVKDPWFVEANGTQPESWKPYNTGFTPVTMPNGGVFLGEGGSISNLSYPFYSTRITYSQTTLAGTDAWFQNWSGPAGSIASPTSLETAVIFKAANDVIKANYKGHLRTGAPEKADQKNQRRSDGFLTVYESMGEIWLTQVDGYGNWSPEIRLSFGTGTAKNPSISNWVSVQYGSKAVITWVENGWVYFQPVRYDNAGGSVSFTWDNQGTGVREFTSKSWISPNGRPVATLYIAGESLHIWFAFEGINGGIETGYINFSNSYSSTFMSGTFQGLSSISTHSGDECPILINQPAASGFAAKKAIYFLAGGYAAGKRIAEFNLDNDVTTVFPVNNSEYTFTSLSGGVNPTSASYTLVAAAQRNLSGGVISYDTEIYQKASYYSVTSLPSLSKIYSNATNPVVMVDNTPYIGSPVYEVNFKQGANWYKATGGSTLTLIGTNIAGIFASEQVWSGTRKSVVVKTNTSPASLVAYSGSGVLNKGESVLYADVRSVRNYTTLSGQSKTAILDFAGALVEPVDSLENGSAICAVKLIAPDQNTIIVRQPDSIKTALAIDLIRNGVSVRSYSASLWDELSINSFEDVQDGDVLVFRLGFPVVSSWGYEIYDFNGTSLTKNEEKTADAVKLKKLENGVSVYPNPFNPNTHISVSLEAPASVKVMVFNILGQLVSDFGKADLGAGVHTYAFDGKTLASGTYFYRVEIGEKVKTGKLQLLK
ncbi:MAG: T9SS type A sorting domain-containing protein [Bacteroidetes bacterium]|nr:T9SS type A sorting domain-containing protein [Bacteroidota bacterium]